MSNNGESREQVLGRTKSRTQKALERIFKAKAGEFIDAVSLTLRQTNGRNNPSVGFLTKSRTNLDNHEIASLNSSNRF